MVLLLPDDLGMDDDSDMVEAGAGMLFSALYALVVSVDDFLGMVDDDSGMVW